MTGKIPSDAFEYYVSLGPGRSYRAVAEHYEVTKRAVTKHAGREGWAERLDKIEQEARDDSDMRLIEVLRETHERHLKTVRAMQARALAALKQYPLASGTRPFWPPRRAESGFSGIGLPLSAGSRMHGPAVEAQVEEVQDEVQDRVRSQDRGRAGTILASTRGEWAFAAHDRSVSAPRSASRSVARGWA